MAAVVTLNSAPMAALSTFVGSPSGALPSWLSFLFVFGLPLVPAALIVIPSLLVGRLPGRLTVINEWIWLAAAVALFAVPAAALGHVRLEELPNTTGDPDLPATISTWVVADGFLLWPTVAAVLGGLVIAGIGFVVGYVARGGSARGAVIAAAIMTFLGLLLFFGYAIYDFGSTLAAHARESGHSATLRGLPYMFWLAVPSIAVLAGAERTVVDGAD
jgi:hypothetical protein